MTEYRDDPTLGPGEKEITMRFARDEDRVTITAEITSWVRWLDHHPEFNETWRRETDGVVHAVSGTLPLGVLQLSGNPRKSTEPASPLGKLPTEAEA